MQVVLLDVETTSLDPRTGQILELAAIAYDVAADKIVSTFRCTFKHDIITGQPYALAMNSLLLYEIAAKDTDYQPVSLVKIEETLNASPDTIWHLTSFEFVSYFKTWLRSLTDLHGWPLIQLCGAQIGSFDYQFLQNVPSWTMTGNEVAYRQVELGSLLMERGDGKPFSVEKNLARFGLTAVGPVHRAYPDCLNYIQLLKSWWHGPTAMDGTLDVGAKYDVEITRHVGP